MTCADCPATYGELADRGNFADEIDSIAATGRCVACAFQHEHDERIRELKGEVECQTKEG